MKVKTYRREEVYIEALRLHKLSWERRMEGMTPWYKKNTFDDSHLPKTIGDIDYRNAIYDKLLSFVKPMFHIRDNSGSFAAILTFDEALHLLLIPDLVNVNYKDGSQVDLGNYKLMSHNFVIEIME